MLESDQPIAALEQVAHEIRVAFLDHRRRSDDRRSLAIDVGEINARLVAALTGAGFTEQEARSADGHELADGRYAPARKAGE